MGGLCFSSSVTFVTFGRCWAAGELGALCFSEAVTVVTWVLLAAGELFLRIRHFCHFLVLWGLLGSWGLDSQNPSLLSLGGLSMGLVANRAPLHAPQGEVTKVTTFLKQGCCQKARIDK